MWQGINWPMGPCPRGAREIIPLHLNRNLFSNHILVVSYRLIIIIIATKEIKYKCHTLYRPTYPRSVLDDSTSDSFDYFILRLLKWHSHLSQTGWCMATCVKMLPRPGNSGYTEIRSVLLDSMDIAAGELQSSENTIGCRRTFVFNMRVFL